MIKTGPNLEKIGELIELSSLQSGDFLINQQNRKFKVITQIGDKTTVLEFVNTGTLSKTVKNSCLVFKAIEKEESRNIIPIEFLWDQDAVSEYYNRDRVTVLSHNKSAGNILQAIEIGHKHYYNPEIVKTVSWDVLRRAFEAERTEDATIVGDVVFTVDVAKKFDITAPTVLMLMKAGKIPQAEGRLHGRQYYWKKEVIDNCDYVRGKPVTEKIRKGDEFLVEKKRNEKLKVQRKNDKVRDINVLLERTASNIEKDLEKEEKDVR